MKAHDTSTNVLALAAALAGAAGCNKTPDAKPGDAPSAEVDKEPFGRMTVDELDKRIADAKAGKGAVFVYDNNHKDRFEKSHIPGAKWVKFDAVSQADLPADKEAALVFYCANEQCGASHKAAARAVVAGYTDVKVLPAGIAGWKKAGKPTQQL